MSLNVSFDRSQSLIFLIQDLCALILTLFLICHQIINICDSQSKLAFYDWPKCVQSASLMENIYDDVAFPATANQFQICRHEKIIRAAFDFM